MPAPWESQLSRDIKFLHWITMVWRRASHAEFHDCEFSLSWQTLRIYSEIYPPRDLCSDGPPHHAHRISQRWFRLMIVSLLLNQNLCFLCFKRQKLKTSEFGVRKDLLIQEVSTKKIGGLMMPQIHLARWTQIRVYNGLRVIGIWRCWWDKF